MRGACMLSSSYFLACGTFLLSGVRLPVRAGGFCGARGLLIMRLFAGEHMNACMHACMVCVLNLGVCSFM